MLIPLQQFIQDRILLSIYPGCSIEEAREKDLSYGCILYTNEKFKREPVGTIKRIGWLNKPQECKDMSMYDIIGLPPTLPRVLHALGDKYVFWNGEIVELELCRYEYEIEYIGNGRKLLNEDGTDAILRDQSEETQKAIALLLGWKDE